MIKATTRSSFPIRRLGSSDWVLDVYYIWDLSIKREVSSLDLISQLKKQMAGTLGYLVQEIRRKRSFLSSNSGETTSLSWLVSFFFFFFLFQGSLFNFSFGTTQTWVLNDEPLWIKYKPYPSQKTTKGILSETLDYSRNWIWNEWIMPI